MKRTLQHIIIALAIILQATIGAMAQTVSLDSCRNMALRNNKQMQITREQQHGANYQRKAAKAAYLPSLDFSGMYIYNQKNISLLESDQMLPTMSFDPQTGGYNYNLVTDATGAPLIVNGQPVPSTVAVIPKSAMTFDIHNVFAGAVTLTQPIYMGGKIRAMNEMTRYAEHLAQSSHNAAAAEVICNVDAAYWQVVSLKAKYELAQSYVNLLDTLSRNVDAMLAQGVATRADQLSVAVKLNEANVDLTKVQNGLALARMALAQVCGLPLNETFTLADENREIEIEQLPASTYDMDEVYSRRGELQSLEAAVKIYEAKAKVERAAMLPSVAVMGTYSFTNPNLFNGFQKEFNGMFSVGAVLKIPLWHWGGNYNHSAPIATRRSPRKSGITSEPSLFQSKRINKDLHDDTLKPCKSRGELEASTIGVQRRCADIRRCDDGSNSLAKSQQREHRCPNRCAAVQRVSFKSSRYIGTNPTTRIIS